MATALMLARRFPRAAAARQLGVSRQALQQWLSAHIEGPLRAMGSEVPSSLSVQDVWAVAVARCVRASGESSAVALAAYRFLAGLPGEEVEHLVKTGRSCVLVVGGTLVPRLMRRDCLQFAEVRALLRDAAAAGVSVRTLLVDCGPLLKQIVEAVER